VSRVAADRGRRASGRERGRKALAKHPRHSSHIIVPRTLLHTPSPSQLHPEGSWLVPSGVNTASYIHPERNAFPIARCAALETRYLLGRFHTSRLAMPPVSHCCMSIHVPTPASSASQTLMMTPRRLSPPPVSMLSRCVRRPGAIDVVRAWTGLRGAFLRCVAATQMRPRLPGNALTLVFPAPGSRPGAFPGSPSPWRGSASLPHAFSHAHSHCRVGVHVCTVMFRAFVAPALAVPSRGGFKTCYLNFVAREGPLGQMWSITHVATLRCAINPSCPSAASSWMKGLLLPDVAPGDDSA